MAFKKVSQLKDSIESILDGLTLDTVDDADGGLEQAARTVVQQVSIPEAVGRQSVTLYGNVFDYEMTDKMFGTSFIDFRPQGTARSSIDRVSKENIETFDRLKREFTNGYKIAIEYKNGTPILRVSAPRTLPTATLDLLDATTGWTASGSASALTLDELVYYESPASLRVTLTGASTGYLTKAINRIDLTDYQGQGVIFIAVRTPSASSLTSLTIRLGSDSGNYYEVSATTGFLGAWEDDEWTIVALDLAQATTTGTPVITAIDYARIGVAHTATTVNFRIGSLFISLPVPHELIYESAAIFKASGEDPSTVISDDNDDVLLSGPAYTLLEYEGALTIAMRAGGTAASGKITMLKSTLHGGGGDIGLYARFRGDNPPSKVKETTSYYAIRGFRKK